jgi:hypothetical protein
MQDRFVTFLRTQSLIEAEMKKAWLQEAGIPCQIRYEQMRKIFGDNAYAGLPMYTELMVPSTLLDAANQRMADQYDIDPDHVPDFCPACEAKTIKGKFDCPDCGLFLG